MNTPEKIMNAKERAKELARIRAHGASLDNKKAILHSLDPFSANSTVPISAAIFNKKQIHEFASQQRQTAESQALQSCAHAQTKSQSRPRSSSQAKPKPIQGMSMPSPSEVEAEVISPSLPSSSSSPSRSLTRQELFEMTAQDSTTRPEVLRLLNSLNINLNLQLSKTDTANLLACLLTANETQLQALRSNKRIPLAVRTIIKRLIEDDKLANTETIERLWNRIFGKDPLSLSTVPTQSAVEAGILPNQPISREAYMIIRETLLK